MAAMTSGRMTAGGRSSFTPDGVLVHRRLDRTPEPADKFRKLSPGNKESLYNLRSAVEETKIKMSMLKEDVDEKQSQIENERELRRAAEEQLVKLVDMYGDPAVNEELRQRLPRSSPKRSNQSPRFADHRSPRSEKLTSAGVHKRDMEAGREGFYPGDVRRSLDFGDAHDQKARSQKIRGRRSRSLPSGSSDQDSDTGARNSTSITKLDPGHPPGVLYPMMIHQGVAYVSPTHSDSLPGAVVPCVAKVPYLLGPLPQVTPGNTPHVTVTSGPNSTSQSSTTQPATLTGKPIVANPLHSSVGTCNTVVGGPSHNLSALTSLSDLGSTSAQQVAYLLEELRLEREKSTKLQEKLVSCEMDLESAHRALQTKDIEAKASLTNEISDAIEEVRLRQKDQDEAMLGRIRLANEERDNIYYRLKQYETRGDESEELGIFNEEDSEYSSDEFMELDCENLISRLRSETSPKNVETVGDVIVARIQQTQKRQEEVVAEEMQVVLEERDFALAECHKLRKQLGHIELTEFQKTKTMGQELSLSRLKVENLEDELQTLRLYHSLGKDVLTASEMNNTVDLYEVQLQEKNSHVDCVQKENNLLLSKLRDATDDLAKVRASLNESQAENNRLTRLVRVLQRKVNETQIS